VANINLKIKDKPDKKIKNKIKETEQTEHVKFNLKDLNDKLDKTM